MLQRVEQKMDELHMVSSEETVLAAVSGGADSVCLLLILDALSKSRGFHLEVVHVEHGIRGEESLQDAAFVNDLCQKMEIPCHSVSVDVPGFAKEKGIGLEEAARILRYQVFEDVAKDRGAKVALAHHMEDNAETILFQLARGSSLTGLGGMHPIRKGENGVTYIRPLLSIHRKEIEGYLEKYHQEFCQDSTNAELDYSRNYLRNIILPELNQVNEKAVTHINAAAESLTEIRGFMNQAVLECWPKVTESNNDELVLNVEKLLVLHKALQKEVAYKAISEVMGTKKDIMTVHVTDLLELCKNQSGRELHLPNKVVAKKEYDRVHIFKQRETIEEDIYIQVSRDLLERCAEEEKTLTITLRGKDENISIRVFKNQGNSCEIPKNSCTKWLDYDKIKQGFCIRTRQSGDYFISDVFGHRKKLKQYFIDEKIPSAKRASMCLLAQDDLVLWLIGGRISEHVKIAEDTKYIVEITYKGDK